MLYRRAHLINRRSIQQGFTLVEVMVALTVVAVTLPALLFLLSQQVDGTAYLRDRSVAQWVAADRVAEVRLTVAKQRRATTGVIRCQRVKFISLHIRDIYVIRVFPPDSWDNPFHKTFSRQNQNHRPVIV